MEFYIVSVSLDSKLFGDVTGAQVQQKFIVGNVCIIPPFPLRNKLAINTNMAMCYYVCYTVLQYSS